MTTFDNLTNDLSDYIYEHLHKSYITDLHKELDDSFKGLYKFNLLESKYGEIEDKYGSHYAELWMDTIVPSIEDEINEEHSSSKKLSTILSFEQQEHLFLKYYLDGNKYDLEDWWGNNNGIEEE